MFALYLVYETRVTNPLPTLPDRLLKSLVISVCLRHIVYCIIYSNVVCR